MADIDYTQFTDKMKKTSEVLGTQFDSVRAGRANAARARREPTQIFLAGWLAPCCPQGRWACTGHHLGQAPKINR